jgi:LPXTG-motif cell wall-anchored protein
VTPIGTITPSIPDVNGVTALPSTGYPPSTEAPQSSPIRLSLVVGAVVMAAGGLVLWRRRRLR